MFNYQPHFPYKIIRPAQSTAIEFALDTFLNSEKKYAIIEAGTGVGKSAIGFTIASYLFMKIIAFAFVLLSLGEGSSSCFPICIQQASEDAFSCTK